MRVKVFGVIGAAAAGLLLLAVAVVQAQSEDPAADPVVAVVDGQELHRSDVIESASSLPPAYQQNIDRIFPALLDRLIDLTLLAKEGRERDLQDDETVRAMVTDFEDQAIREILLQRYLEEALTDEAVQQRYAERVEDFEPVPEVRARHILVETKEEAEAIIEELKAGANFEELAQSRSTGPSGPEGGDLGYFVADQMVPEFAEAAFALEEGAITQEPVQTQFGWHVIKVEDRREREAPSLEEMRAEIEGELSQELVTAFLADLREDAEIEKFIPETPPAAEAPAESPAEGAGEPAE
ncbi:peptidylprolyl isomerase [Rhodospirillaceae bacterium SYSU D60014]|uniref:peptidylprolyl isomerase n=1 Tax=Virgifigura deserti TaxID=2268457 RepID=UPI0013C40924